MPYGVGAHRHMPEIDQELAALGAPVTATFTPHLMPLDQGELVSCYVTTTEPWSQEDLDGAYEVWAERHPFLEVVDTPPGVRDVRDSNVCRIHARADERTGKVLVFAALDNLWKGAASQAIQNLNLMFGLRRDAGDRAMSFFASRWIEQPGHVADADGGGLPAGFRAAGVAAQIKPSGGLDVGPAGVRRGGGDERGALHALGRPRGAGARHRRSAPASMRCASWSPTPATPTRPPERAASRSRSARRTPPRARRGSSPSR